MNNISFKSNNSTYTTLRGNNDMQDKDFKDVQKDIIKKLYTRARQEMTQSGQFDKIVEQFKNPKSDKVYIIEISSSQAEDISSKRYLTLGCEIENSPNKLTIALTDGSKQEILDYLGNDSNLEEISAYYKMLEEKTDNM